MDTKLTAALAEIDDILAKYELGGFVVLASQDYGTMKLLLPAWSKIQHTPDRKRFILHLSRETSYDELDSTCHLVDSVRDSCERMFLCMEELTGHIEAFTDED